MQVTTHSWGTVNDANVFHYFVIGQAGQARIAFCFHPGEIVDEEEMDCDTIHWVSETSPSV